MLYSVTPDLQKKDISSRYLLPGIHENVELVSINYKKTEKGSELIEFNFENAAKEMFTHTEWKVMSNRDVNAFSEKEKELYLRLVKAQVKKLNTIATTFIPEQKFAQVGGNTFEEFCKSAIAAIGDSYKGVKIRLKVVYDKRNFVSLPSYSNHDWIEPMTVPKENSRIRILTGARGDKMEKSPLPQLEGANNRKNEIESISMLEATSPAAPPANEEDLPF